MSQEDHFFFLSSAEEKQPDPLRGINLHIAAKGLGLGHGGDLAASQPGWWDVLTHAIGGGCAMISATETQPAADVASPLSEHASSLVWKHMR